MAQIHNAAGDHTLDITADGEALVKFLTPPEVTLPTSQRILVRPEYSATARGDIAGQTSEPLTGYNAGVGTAFEPVWAVSGTSYPWRSTAATLTVSSSATTDVYGTGAGAWVVKVEGLDANWLPISEFVNLNGRNAVSTVNSYLRVNALTVVAAGANAANDGVVYVGYGTVAAGVPANVLAAVAIGENNSLQMVYSVPAGYRLELVAYRASLSAAGTVKFNIRYNPTPGLFYTAYALPLPAGIGVINAILPMHLPAKTDMILLAAATTGTIAVGMIFEAVLEAV